MTSKSVQTTLRNYDIELMKEMKINENDKDYLKYLNENIEFIWKNNGKNIKCRIYIQTFKYYIHDICWKYENKFSTIPQLNQFLCLIPLLYSAYEQNETFKENCIFEDFWKRYHLNFFEYMINFIERKLNVKIFDKFQGCFGILYDSRWMASYNTYTKTDLERTKNFIEYIEEILSNKYKPQTIKNILSFINFVKIFFNETKYKIEDSEEIEIEEIEDF